MNEPDDDTNSVNFGHPEHERLQFVFPPCRPDSEGWLNPTVTVSSGPFSGSTKVYCTVSDFMRFLPDLRRLHETLCGSATFDTIESQIGFTLIGDGLGHITLRGFLDDRAGGSNKLQFQIDYDQTLLWHSIAELQDFLATHSQ